MPEDRNIARVFGEMLKSAKTSQAIQSQVQKTVGAVSGHVREVLGPLAEAFDFIKHSLANIFNFFKGIALDAFGTVKKIFGFGKGPAEKTAENTEKSTGYLKSILDVFRRTEKQKAIEGIGKGKGKKGLQGWLLLLFGGIAAAIGGILGGLARRFVLPFEIFLGAIKRLPFIGKAIGGIIDWFGKLKLIQKITGFGPVKKFIDIFKGVIGKFSFLTKIFKTGGGVLGRFATSFMKGFKILGWPFTVLLGVIDFIKGFMGTEGTLMQKLQGGLSEAIKGFIELPAKVVGWIGEKLLGLAGIQVEKGEIAGKIMGFVDKVVDMIFHPWDYLMAGVKKFTGWFIDLWNGLMDGIINLAKKADWIPGIGSVIAAAEGMKFEKTAPEDKVGQAEGDRQKALAKSKADEVQRQKDTQKATEDTNKKLDKVAKEQAATTNIIQAQGSTRVDEAPKEAPSSQAQDALDIWATNAF